MKRKRECKIDDKCKMEYDGKVLFVVFNGVRIAKRDLKLKIWTSIKPGWTVTDEPDGKIKYGWLRVEYDGVQRH